MTIKLLVLGKTDSTQLSQLIEEYQNRLKHYIKFELEIIPDIKNTKNLSEKQQKEKEGNAILNKLNATDLLVLLDEKGNKKLPWNSRNTSKKHELWPKATRICHWRPLRV